jgi:nucleoside phosphorylase/CheY-like chemotaxis protein
MVSILIVDDSADKVQRVKDYIARSARNAIEWAEAANLAAARKAVREAHFDILILDVALPAFADEPARPRAGLDFLKEIAIDDGLVMPTYIVGITEHYEDFDALELEFEQRAWVLYRCDRDTDGWLARIAQLVNRVQIASTQVVSKADFVVLTALYDPEMLAVLGLPWNWSSGEQLDEATIVRRGSFVMGGRSFSVIVTWPQRMGLVVSATLASKMIQAFRPRILATSGICAGIRGQVELGDIVFASEAWTWESGKIIASPVPRTLLPDPHSFAAATSTVTIAQDLHNDGAWLESVHREYKLKNGVEFPPQLKIGPIASGSAVVADNDTVQSIVSKHRKTVAIDMESYAIYAAAALNGQPVPACFSVKSVCDFADEGKNDAVQQYASYTSARALQRIFAELARALI